MFVNGTLFVPKAIKLYKTKCSKDLSLISFCGFNLIQLTMVVHGYAEGDWALAIGMGYSFFTCAVVTFLIYYYRKARLK